MVGWQAGWLAGRLAGWQADWLAGLFWERNGLKMPIGIFPFLGREGVVVMVIHICLLRVSSPPLGKGRGGGHGHTQPSAQKFASSSGKGKG